jgi:PIN domain nuclease of toxin-antitoxin system
MAGRGTLMLLDTCALLWLAEGGKELSAAARAQIESSTVVYVSAISAFEIGLKHRAGKLALPVPPGAWFRRLVEHHGLAVLPLDWDVCLAATELPPLHRDPCDPFIIATAKLRRLPVVTADPRFRDYGVELV